MHTPFNPFRADNKPAYQTYFAAVEFAAAQAKQKANRIQYRRYFSDTVIDAQFITLTTNNPE